MTNYYFFSIVLFFFLLISERNLAKLSSYKNIGLMLENNFQCYDNISIHGLILARKGSKGIKNKNLVKVGGKSILRRSIETMTSFKKFSSIWVSTDGEKIAKQAEKYAASVHWRADETATDTATSLIAMQEFVRGHADIERIALIQCTSPFLDIKYLDEAYKLVQQGFDTVFSVTREFKLRWKQNSDERIFPINFNPAKRPRRQDWNGELVENGMFYFTKKSFLQNGVIQGGRIGVVVVPKYASLEIDSEEDLKLARSLDKI